MRELALLGRDEARALRGVFFDLDDTVLTHGLLTREAYEAIWALHDAGLALVAVTGRPSGWGEVIARQWPIDGAVTENGAVFLRREGKGIAVLTEGDDVARRTKLDAIVADVARRLPHVTLADDNAARRTDVAWDIGERVTLPADEIAALGAIVIEHGAKTLRSTVHLHASFEAADKATGAARFAREHLEDSTDVFRTWAFCGDSPNDAACFTAFESTFGVANVRAFEAVLPKAPRYVARREMGAGFAEIARTLLALR